MTDWSGPFIAVDWGTTNRRAYRVAADGTVEADFEDDLGVTAVPPGGFETAVADIRERLGDTPLLLAGMVGSNRGWVDVPYVQAPAALGDLAAALHWVAEDIAIVPGVRLTGARSDIMRGEEVQALGAVAAGRVAPDAHICHPGTHAKWMTLEGGRLSDFRTAMTGEVFALLKAHSILQLGGEVAVGASFFDGVDLAFDEPLLDALFSVRSRVVLGELRPDDTAAYASGLLIGSDVAAHARAGGRVTLLGRPELCELYAAALDRRGCTSAAIDGAEAFVAGMSAIRKLLP